MPVLSSRNVFERHRYRLLLCLIFVAGAALRLVDYPRIPPGLKDDEASSAYEAWSLLHTCADRWGNVWPPYFPNWGSGQNVMLSYLSVPVVRMLGLTPFSARLVPVILGILTVALVAWATRPLGRWPAAMGMLLVAIVPWHFMLSRWALESNLAPFFMLAGCGMLCRALITGRRRWIVPCLLPFAGALYSYGTTAVVLPVMGFLLLVLYWQRLGTQRGAWIAALGLFVVAAFPFAVFFLENQVLGRNLAWAEHLPFSTPLLPSNRLAQVSGGDWWRTLRMNLAFVTNGFIDGSPYNEMPGYSLLLLSTLPLAIAGMVAGIIVTGRAKARKLVFSPAMVVLSVFLCWMLAALPMLAMFVQNVNRFNHFYLPAIVLAVWAANRMIAHLDVPVPKRLVRTFLVVCLLAEAGLGVAHYFTDYERGPIAERFNVGLEEAFAEVKKLPAGQVRISENMSLPYVMTLFFTQYPPGDFQRSAVYKVVNGEYEVARFGRYVFHADALVPAQPYGYLARKGDMPEGGPPAHHVLWRNDGWEVGMVDSGWSTRQ